jgi:hypothetical protein
MQRFWVIRHDHNDLFLAPDTHPRLWTRNELAAKRFDTEDAALDEIIYGFNGKGHAVQIVAPVDCVVEPLTIGGRAQYVPAPELPRCVDTSFL